MQIVPACASKSTTYKVLDASGDLESYGRVLLFAAKSLWDKRLAFGDEWMNGGAAKPPARAKEEGAFFAATEGKKRVF